MSDMTWEILQTLFMLGTWVTVMINVRRTKE
jgi:hypothetical protein